MCKIYLFSCDWQVMKLLFPNGLLRIWDCHRCYLPFGYNIVMEANLNIATCTSAGTVCRNFFSIIVDWN